MRAVSHQPRASVGVRDEADAGARAVEGDGTRQVGLARDSSRLVSHDRSSGKLWAEKSVS